MTKILVKHNNVNTSDNYAGVQQNTQVDELRKELEVIKTFLENRSVAVDVVGTYTHDKDIPIAKTYHLVDGKEITIDNSGKISFFLPKFHQLQFNRNGNHQLAMFWFTKTMKRMHGFDIDTILHTFEKSISVAKKLNFS